MQYSGVYIILEVIIFLGTSVKTVRSFEVQVSGINHKSTCPTSCLNASCHYNNSRVICTDGCEEGRRGDNCNVNCPPKCSECSKYPGDSCEKLCLDNCEGGCDRYKWQCASCKPGFTGRFCDTCMKGFRGYLCNEKCPDYCHDGCERNSGFCSWIDNAYRGKYCITNSSEFCLECESNGLCKHCFPYFWGDICNHTCPTNCDGPGCDRHTGKCIECIDGYWGYFCNQTCPTNCGKSGCRRSSGECRCEDGYWSDNCNISCPNNCDVCYKYSGECFICNDGYWGDNCNKSCPTYCGWSSCKMHTGKCSGCRRGYWGNICSQTCPSNCERSRCDIDTGKCRRCMDGYMGSYCNITCPPGCISCKMDTGQCIGCKNGYRGHFCNMSCSRHSSLCDQFTGDCYGCKTGYQGGYCNETCPSNCKGGCNKYTGVCVACEKRYAGRHCSSTCSTDCEICDFDTGHCTRCITGKKGQFCEQSCDPSACVSCDLHNEECGTCRPGSKGKYCNCSDNCESCDEITGHCISCTREKKGQFCNESCPSTCVACDMHNCICGDNCETCNPITGRCERCKDGLNGHFCNETCPTFCTQCERYGESCKGPCVNDSYYGESCSIPCPEACAGCEKATGSCVNCAQGYSRVYCDEMCTLCSQPQICSSKPCVHRGNSWLWMVVVGTLSSFCIIALSGMVWAKHARKIRRSDDRQEETGSIPTDPQDPQDPHEYHLPSNHYYEIAYNDLESGSAPECDFLSQSLRPPLPAPRTTTTNESGFISQEIKHLESHVSNSQFLMLGARPLPSCRESAKTNKDQGIMKLGTDPLSLPPPLCPPPKVSLNESHTHAKRKLQENALQSSHNMHEADHGFPHPTFLLQPLLPQQHVDIRSTATQAQAPQENKSLVADHFAINPPLCPRPQMLGGNNEILHEELKLDSYCAKDFISVPLHTDHIKQKMKPASYPLSRIQRSKNIDGVSFDTTEQSHLRSRTLLPNRKPPCDNRRMLMEIPSHEPALSFVFEADEVFENPLYRKSAASTTKNLEEVQVRAFEDHDGFRTVNFSHVEIRNPQAPEQHHHQRFLKRRFSESDLLTIKCKMTEYYTQIRRSKSDIIKSENSELQNDFADFNSAYMYITPVMEHNFLPKPML